MTDLDGIDQIVGTASGRLDRARLRQQYLDQDEFLVVESFLPSDLLARWEAELEILKPHLHRNFIPKHKKGGSIGYETIRALAPSINAVYQSQALLQFLRALVDAEIQECPDSDPHRCALYAYTEEGDHIGWHYDTSYYKDRRWTVLVGLQDQSASRLVCRLYTRRPGRAVEDLELQVAPGMLVLFNGDKVHHAVTPLHKGEHRFIISMQYVTNGEMNPFMSFVSNMKDSIAYFGWRQVFGRRKKNADAKTASIAPP
jgi:2OG-Fe(II) oxygenase superfamily